MRLSGATRVAGVVGRPIVHSMSPILHNAWLAAAGIDGVYAPFSTEPGRFTAFAQSLRGGSVAGWSLGGIPLSAGVHREDAPPTEEQKLDKLKDAGKAWLETDEGRALKARILADPLVKSIADLARQLRIEVVAEGVSSGTQLELLAKLGIPTAQGYLLGLPGPLDRLPLGMNLRQLLGTSLGDLDRRVYADLLIG